MSDQQDRMGRRTTIKVQELGISTFGDKDQFCTYHDKETCEIQSSCIYYEDAEMFCLIFHDPDRQNELEWDKEHHEFLRHKKCLEAEVK